MTSFTKQRDALVEDAKTRESRGPYLHIEIETTGMSDKEATWLLKRLRSWMPEAFKILADEDVTIKRCVVRNAVRDD